MKTPRFFILVGACALLMSVCLVTIEAPRPAAAGTLLNIVRFDPRAGDPEEPGFSKSMPFDEEASYGRTQVPLETHRTPEPSAIGNTRGHYFQLISLLFGRWR
jgi:hypothetical protein